MKRVATIVSVGLALGLGVIGAVALLWLLGGGLSIVQAQGPDGYSVYYVAPSCAGVPVPCYTSVQAAVDAADDPNDVIKVAAGTYTGVQGRPAPAGYAGLEVITQVVYISKTLTVRGGYSTIDWIEFAPDTNSTILDAQKQGRVIFVAGDISPTLEGLQIVNGDSAGLGGGKPASSDAGGGVYVISATVTLSTSQVLSNEAIARGGGLYAAYNDGMRLSDNRVSYNDAALGGGLYLYASSDATLEGNTIRANGAGSIGGGLRIRASPHVNLVGNEIIDSYCVGLGVNHVGGLSLFESDHATLIDNVFRGNFTEGWAGGLEINGCRHAKLTGNVFDGNDSKEGSGVRIVNSEHVELADSVIRGNSCRHGSGVLVSSSSHLTLTNNVIADNQATGMGSGMYVDDSSLRLLHTTIARNSGGDGSGVYITGSDSTMVLTNTILVSHAVGITVAAGNTAMLEATLWGTGTWANENDWGGTGTILTGTINIWDAPIFVDSDVGDYHIGPGSGAVNTGVDAGVDDDIDGEPRPSGLGYDIGADEYHCIIYLPLVLKNY